MNKHIHFIGICGVAMSALAIAFHKKGYKVTGSDKGFYPPVSTHLKNAGVEYYPGWHVDKMTANGDPDLVIVGNVAGSTNPEWVYVQKNNLEYKSYPEAVAEFFLHERSIVCAGTYGKTTTSTLLSWIMKESDVEANYMFGGLAVNNDFPSAALFNAPKYSILEGDEYKSSRWDDRAKFFHYKPNYLLLTAVEWDHADMYKTEESYFNAFEELITNAGPQLSAVYSENIPERIKSAFLDEDPVTYGVKINNDYYYSNVEQTKNGITFDIHYKDGYSKDAVSHITSPLLGMYNAENITACFAMTHQIAFQPEEIVKAIAAFKGIKRRLEKRVDGDITVIDDIAHSPAKANSVLTNLRAIYSGKIIAVFEPNTGNRRIESAPGYDSAFVAADEVIIPRLTKIKVAENETDIPFDGEELAKVISKTHKSVTHITNDDELVDYLIENTKKEDVIVFLGSHGFRGMIEVVVEKLQ